MKFISDLFESEHSSGFEALEPRQLLSGDLAINDVSCDARVNWLVPGDRFNVIAELINAGADAPTVGRVDLSVYATDGTNEFYLGVKPNVAFNLAAGRKLRVPVPVTLDFGFIPGDYTFKVKADRIQSFADADLDNNERAISQGALTAGPTNPQVSYQWELAYRIGTYDAGSQGITGDTRASLRRAVRLSGTVTEPLLKNGALQYDTAGVPREVAKRISMSLTGAGRAELSLEDLASELTFIDTDKTSAFAATVTGGLRTFDFFNQYNLEGILVRVESDRVAVPTLRSFSAPGFNFTSGSSLMFDNGLSDFTCNALINSSLMVGTPDTSTVTASNALMTSFTANAVSNSDLVVYAPLVAATGMRFVSRTSVIDSELTVNGGKIASVNVGAWSGGVLTASAIGTIDSAGAFDCDLTTTGANRQFMVGKTASNPFGAEQPFLDRNSLVRMTVRGIVSGTWDLDGNVGAMTIGQIDAVNTGPLSISIAGRLDRFATTSTISGRPLNGAPSLGLYAFSMNSVTLASHVDYVEIHSGYALPTEDTPWVPSSLRDTTSKIGFIRSFVGRGDVRNSDIFAGYNPNWGAIVNTVSGPNTPIFDHFTADMRSITLSGQIAGSTAFRAAVLPTSVKVKVDGYQQIQTVVSNPATSAPAFNFQSIGNRDPWFATRIFN